MKEDTLRDCVQKFSKEDTLRDCSEIQFSVSLRWSLMLRISLRSPSPHWWILWACCTAGTWTPVCMVLLCFSVQAERAGVRRGWWKTSTGHTHPGHVSRWESQSGAGYQGEKHAAISGAFMCSGKPIWAPPLSQKFPYHFLSNSLNVGPFSSFQGRWSGTFSCYRWSVVLWPWLCIHR